MNEKVLNLENQLEESLSIVELEERFELGAVAASRCDGNDVKTTASAV